MLKKGWTSVLEAATAGCCGENGCCQCVEDGAECCMTDQAREVFEMIEAAGGPPLEQIEAIARGELIVAKPMTTEGT